MTELGGFRSKILNHKLFPLKNEKKIGEISPSNVKGPNVTDISNENISSSNSLSSIHKSMDESNSVEIFIQEEGGKKFMKNKKPEQSKLLKKDESHVKKKKDKKKVSFDDDHDVKEKVYSVISSPPTFPRHVSNKGDTFKELYSFFLHRRNANYFKTTKYTFLTFFPLNLFFQLRKVSNMYFIIIMCINLIPYVSVAPITSVLPVLIIMGVNMIKDAFEDILRYLADLEVNNISVQRYNQVKNVFNSKTKTCHVGKGDIIRVNEGETIPVDMVLLKSSKTSGFAFLQTANLDGETNLKKKESANLSVLGKDLTIEKVCSQKMEFTVPKINSEDLEDFEGTLKLIGVAHEADVAEIKEEKEEEVAVSKELIEKNGYNSKDEGARISLGSDNLLLKGCKLTNTEYVIGTAVYVGKNSKICRNKQKAKAKWGKLDVGLNRFVFILFGIQQSLIVLFVTISYIVDWLVIRDKSWYLERYVFFPPMASPEYGLIYNILLPAEKRTNDIWFSIIYFGTGWMSYFVLFSIVIPMSLFVTMEVIKVAQAKLMEFGIKKMKAKTSNLNWDLAFIDIIFSDKTGTLTKNEMDYQETFVVDKKFKGKNDSLRKEMELLSKDGNKYEKCKHFLINLVVNNSLNARISKKKKGELIYDGESTDEICIVTDLAVRNGAILLSRNSKEIKFKLFEKEIKFKIMHIFPFSSKRKRMSVMIRDIESGKIYVYSKGADSEMFKRATSKSKDEEDLIEKFHVATMEYSKMGYRTLVFSYKEITQSTYNVWFEKYKKAMSDEKNKKMKLQMLYDLMEREFVTLGVTAIEDELQDKVPETIESLLEADIPIWVLTGDKTETAISICHTAKVIKKGIDWEVILTANSYSRDVEELEQRIKMIEDYIVKNHNKKESFVLIVDSDSLRDILEHDHEDIFVNIIKHCSSVICCRVTPLQKSIVTDLVQKKLNKRGLAIGDGANDVSMIQKAYVGVGLYGKEGSQASRSSDYALPGFKYLKNLLFVEGHYAYLRSCDCILMSFYKNCMISVVHIVYSFFNLLSAQKIVDPWVYQIYNTIFHALVPVIFGLFEVDVKKDVLLNNPKLYSKIRKTNPYFSIYRILYWALKGIIHASLCYFLTYFCTIEGSLLGIELTTNDTYMVGHVMTCSVMLTIYLNQILAGKQMSLILILACLGSFLAYVVFVLADGLFPDVLGVVFFYYIPIIALDKLKFYAIITFIVTVNTLPVFAWCYIQSKIFPAEWQKVQAIETKKIKHGG